MESKTLQQEDYNYVLSNRNHNSLNYSYETSDYIAHCREFLKLLLVKGFESQMKGVAAAVRFILENLKANTITSFQWNEMLKLFTNELPYTIDAINREGVMFKLGYLTERAKMNFQIFQSELSKVKWEITNREEFEPLIELLNIKQIYLLTRIAIELFTKEQKEHETKEKDEKGKEKKQSISDDDDDASDSYKRPQAFCMPTQAEVLNNMKKRNDYSISNPTWYTTIHRHEWKIPRQRYAAWIPFESVTLSREEARRSSSSSFSSSSSSSSSNSPSIPYLTKS